MTVQVDKNSAAALNAGKDTFEDILVFHLDNGKDYYISFFLAQVTILKRC